jgi:type I restriction enzyme M protein
MAKLTQQQLETHLWGAANILRGKTAGQDYKTYILSLMFFKRLSDQWDYEAEQRIAELEAERSKPFTNIQRQKLLQSPDIHRFAIPIGSDWKDVRGVTTNTG